MHYNYFRDYDPGTGRYVESDLVGLNGGINTYSYVGGSPTIKVDPYGLWSATFGGYSGPGF
jgi:RHS repeat-associated protein